MLGLGRDILRLVSTGVTGGGGGPALGYTPPLDSIDSVAAYSVRKMRTDYSGACIEAYRVSDGATQDIGFDGDGLINTADIISFASGSQVLVRTWYNQGTSGPDAVSLIGEYPEIYDGTSIRMMNGRPCLFPQNNAVGFSDIPINISDLQPLPWTRWTAFSVSKANTNLGVFALFNQSPNVRINIVTPFVPTSNDGALQGISIDTAGTGGIYYQGVDKGSFVTRGDTFDQFRDYQTISNIVGLETNNSQSTYNDMTLGGTSFFAGYAMHIMQEVVIIPSLSQPSYDQALDVNANQYYQVTNLPDYTSGFLADYPDAAAAYSVRKLSNTAIKCMRVRRAVAPFDEKDIGFTAGGDLDEAAIVAFGGSDVLTVSAWYDQSGQSVHATQITPGFQPQIYNGTAVITDNGKPAISCNNHVLNFSPISLTGDFAISHVGQYNSGQAIYGGPVGDFAAYGLTTLLRWRYSGGNVDFSFNYNVGVQYNDFLNRGSSSNTLQINGANIGTVGSANTFTLSEVFAGNAGAYRLNGKFQELVVWEKDQTSPIDNRTAIETNINDYYEITVNDVAATSGFLFDYPNAAVAYSVRQLNNNAEFAMQVERSDGRTLNIGFDGNGDLDTQAIIDFSGASVATIRTWYDQTGTQNHAVQRNTINQPVIYDGSAVITDNGNPAPEFTDPGTDSNRTFLLWRENVTTQLFSWSCVTSANPTGASRTIFHREKTGTSNYLRLNTNGYTIVKPGDFDNLNGSTFGTQNLNTIIRSSASTATSYQNGSQTGTISTLDASDISWGNIEANITAIGSFSFNVQEIVLWDSDQDAAGNLSAIETDIMTYYNIP